MAPTVIAARLVAPPLTVGARVMLERSERTQRLDAMAEVLFSSENFDIELSGSETLPKRLEVSSGSRQLSAPSAERRTAEAEGRLRVEAAEEKALRQKEAIGRRLLLGSHQRLGAVCFGAWRSWAAEEARRRERGDLEAEMSAAEERGAAVRLQVHEIASSRLRRPSLPFSVLL